MSSLALNCLFWPSYPPKSPWSFQGFSQRVFYSSPAIQAQNLGLWRRVHAGVCTVDLGNKIQIFCLYFEGRRASLWDQPSQRQDSWQGSLNLSQGSKCGIWGRQWTSCELDRGLIKILPKVESFLYHFYPELYFIYSYRTHKLGPLFSFFSWHMRILWGKGMNLSISSDWQQLSV